MLQSLHNRSGLTAMIGIACVSLMGIAQKASGSDENCSCPCCQPAPANLHAQGIWDNNLNKPTDLLIWSPVPGAVSYNVYFGDRQMGSGITATSWIVPTNKFSPNREYYVSAVNAQGVEGRLSRFAPAQGGISPSSNNKADAPHPPNTLTITGEWNNGAPRAFVAWHRQGDTNAFNVYRDGTKIASYVTAPFYYDYNVLPGSRHAYAVSSTAGQMQATSESALTAPVSASMPSSAPGVSGTPIQITSLTPNDDSVLVSFAPVPGAQDYRIFRSDIPEEMKYAGGGQSIELNGIDPSKGADVWVEAVDKLAPYAGTGLVNGAMTMSMIINGLGDPSNMVNVIAKSSTFHVSCQPRSLTGSQVFFDNFAKADTFKQVSGDPACLKAAGGKILYQQYQSTNWRADVFLDDTEGTICFFDHRHLMTLLADYMHTTNSAVVLMPNATADITGGKVLHVTFEVDPHFTTRRWVDIDFTPAGEPVVRPATDAIAPNPTNSGKALTLTFRRDGFSFMRFSTGKPLYSQKFNRDNGAMSDIDKRRRFDIYLSATHLRVIEGGKKEYDSDFTSGWTLPFLQIQPNFVHQLYHTSNEHNELETLYQLETFWVNYRPYCDERHWDNMGFEVLTKFP